MSHYVTIKTVFKDVQCLATALAAVGPAERSNRTCWDVITGKDLVLHGYHGDERSMLPTSDPNYAPPCVIKIDGDQVGSAANDIGVSRSGEGLNMHISEYDATKNGYDEAWIGKVKQHYQLEVLKKEARSKGHHVEYEMKGSKIIGRIVVGTGR